MAAALAILGDRKQSRALFEDTAKSFADISEYRRPDDYLDAQVQQGPFRATYDARALSAKPVTITNASPRPQIDRRNSFSSGSTKRRKNAINVGWRAKNWSYP